MSENKNDHSLYNLSNKDTQFIVIRDPQFDRNGIKKEKYKTFTLVYDFENLSKILDLKNVADFISWLIKEKKYHTTKFNYKKLFNK